MSSADDRGRQLILDLARAPSFDPDDFLVSPSNAEAHALISRWPDWPHRVLLLIGPPGSGKSHLAAIWADWASTTIARSRTGCEELLREPRVQAAVEDADRSDIDETTLFHLLNAAKETDGWLLLTARLHPDRWRLATRDLLSRLRLAPVVEIASPDAALLRAVLVKLFADRQIAIAEDVVAYAALHCEQSLDAITRFVAAVDDDALASGRRITRPLAARTLARIAGERGDQGPT